MSTLLALTWATNAGWLPTDPPATVWSLAGASRWVGEALVLASAGVAALLALGWLAPRRSLRVAVGTRA
jgi:hypothetical protein